MKKIVLAGIVGGLILWIWGFISWVVLPLHTAAERPIPNESEIAETLARALPEKGVYLFPMMPQETADMSPAGQEAAMTAYVAKFQAGPHGRIFFDPAGGDPFMVNQMISGLLIFMLSASIVAWLLSRSTAAGESFLSRVVYCGMIGTLIAVGCYLSEWNWMGYSFDWTRALMFDSIVAWLLAGIGISAIVKQKATAAM
ncbi:MAG TPA: hypothetical protein VI932_02885 [Bacteroidota bacterium]|nr:hypothetical protein [Bacteroidota bacterium]